MVAAVTCVCSHLEEATSVPVPPTSIWQLMENSACPTVQPVSLSARMISAFPSGGSVILRMTVETAQMNLPTAPSLNADQASSSVAQVSAPTQLISVMETTTARTTPMKPTVTSTFACPVSLSARILVAVSLESCVVTVRTTAAREKMKRTVLR